MNLIDTHCHLYSEKFDHDREACIDRALSLGINKIILPNIDATSISGMMDLATRYPKVMFPSMGLHPCSVEKNYEQQLEEIRLHLKKHAFVAIGEIGIDLYWDKSLVEEQKAAFKIQCEWAKELELPIIIHVRDSFNEVFEILDQVNNEKLKGVFHCFSGNAEQAKKALSYGDFYLGIGGVLTFKKSTLPEVIKNIEVSHLMFETDAPYLAPTPFRGKRNEPAYTYHVAEKCAEIKGLPLSELAQISTKNAETLFKL